MQSIIFSNYTIKEFESNVEDRSLISVTQVNGAENSIFQDEVMNGEKMESEILDNASENKSEKANTNLSTQREYRKMKVSNPLKIQKKEIIDENEDIVIEKETSMSKKQQKRPSKEPKNQRSRIALPLTYLRMLMWPKCTFYRRGNIKNKRTF